MRYERAIKEYKRITYVLLYCIIDKHYVTICYYVCYYNFLSLQILYQFVSFWYINLLQCRLNDICNKLILDILVSCCVAIGYKIDAYDGVECKKHSVCIWCIANYMIIRDLCSIE